MWGDVGRCTEIKGDVGDAGRYGRVAPLLSLSWLGLGLGLGFGFGFGFGFGLGYSSESKGRSGGHRHVAPGVSYAPVCVSRALCFVICSCFSFVE